MVVTSQGKGRATPPRAGITKRKDTMKRRNAPAAALAAPRFQARAMKSAKVYSRKGKAIPSEDESA